MHTVAIRINIYAFYLTASSNIKTYFTRRLKRFVILFVTGNLCTPKQICSSVARIDLQASSSVKLKMELEKLEAVVVCPPCRNCGYIGIEAKICS